MNPRGSKPPRHTGALPAVLTVWGCLYVCIGLAWALAPTPGRETALEVAQFDITEVTVRDLFIDPNFDA